MIAYMVATCGLCVGVGETGCPVRLDRARSGSHWPPRRERAKPLVYRPTCLIVNTYPKNGWRLFEKDARALDLLAAQRAQEVRHQPIHQLEVGRQRRRVLLSRVED